MRLAVKANKVQPGRREGRNIVPGVLMVGELGELMKSLADEFGLEVGIKTFPVMWSTR